MHDGTRQQDGEFGKAGAAVLEFRDCRVPVGTGSRETLSLDLQAWPGDLILVQAGDRAHELALADAACGLIAPLEGQVCFLGRDWQDLSVEFANACRGCIGSTLGVDDWLPYLSVLDNLLIPHLYHSRRASRDLCAEAANWAERFGLPGAPDDLPDEIDPEDRRRVSFVRAFLGSPMLVLIEQQRGALPKDLENAVIGVTGDARRKGAAIIWMTRDDKLLHRRDIPATARMHLTNRRLEELEATE